MSVERALVWGLALVLVASPLPFGSVGASAAAAWTAGCLGLGALWIVWRCRRGLTPLPWKDPVLGAGLLCALVGAAQAVPLPRPALEALSPQAVALRDRFEPPLSGAEPGRFSGWRPLSLHPWATRQSTLRLLACLFVALMVSDLAAAPGGRRGVAAALVASGGFQALYGLAEFSSGRQHIFGYAKRFYTDVATGTFINRNHFAGFLEMTLPFAVALGAVALGSAPGKAPLRQRLAQLPGRDLFKASALLLLALTMAVALLCSRSRMGIASAFLALVAVGVGVAWRGQGKGFAVAGVVVLGATVVLFSRGDSGPLVERYLGAGRELQGEAGRGPIWSQALEVVRTFPLTGAGIGAFPEVFPAFRTTGRGVSFAHAHNDFLELAAETGALGGAVFLLGLAMVVRSIGRRAPARPDFGHLGHAALVGLTAIGFHSLTDFNLAIPANALALAALLGIAVCWKRVPPPAPAPAGRPAHPWAHRAAGPAALLCALAALAAAPAAVGAGERGRASEPLANGGATGAVGLLDRNNPLRLFAAARRTADAATRDLHALERARRAGVVPSSVATGYVRARLETAVALQSSALRLLPTSAAGHAALGRLLAAQCAGSDLAAAVSPGECLQGAVREMHSASSLGPMRASMHARMARLLLRNWPVLGDAQRAHARPLLERALALNPRDASLRAEWRTASPEGQP